MTATRNSHTTEFEDALASGEMPASWSAPLRALFLAAKGDWNGAHELVQHEEGAAAAWVHAHLHRSEGDDGNAGYWYRRAGQPPATGDLGSERIAIAAMLMHV